MFALRIPLEAIPDAFDFDDSEDPARPFEADPVSLMPKADVPPASAPAGSTGKPGFHRRRLLPRVLL